MRARLGISAVCVALIATAVPASAPAGTSDAAKRFEAAVASVPLAATAGKKKCSKFKSKKKRRRCRRNRAKRATDFYLDYGIAFNIALQDAALVRSSDPNGTGSGVFGCTRVSRIELRCLAFYNFNKTSGLDQGPWQCNWIVNVALATDGSNRTGYFRTNYNCYPT